MKWPPKPGQVEPWRNLGAMLRTAHEERRTSINDQIAQRTENGIPLDDSEPEGAEPLTEVGEYDGDASYDEVKLRLRVINTAEGDQIVADWLAAIEESGGTVTAAVRKHWAAFVRLSLVAFEITTTGEEYLCEDVGDAELCWLGDAGLMVPVFAAARGLYHLTIDQRGNYGASPPSTSRIASSTVTNAPARDANKRAAGVVPMAPSSTAPSTKATHARDGSPYVTRGSSVRSSTISTAADG